MYRFSIALLAVFMLAFSACVDTGEPEVLDEADDADMIADDDGAPEPFEESLDIWPNYDADGDDYVTMEEYGTGYPEYGMYADYDTDGDTYVSEAEYTTAYGMSDNYATYDMDGDGQLSMDEYRDATFKMMDTDGDGRISRAEYDAYKMKMMGDSM